MTTESHGRNWAGIGVGLAVAFAIIGLYVIVVWAVVILVQAVF